MTTKKTPAKTSKPVAKPAAKNTDKKAKAPVKGKDTKKSDKNPAKNLPGKSVIAAIAQVYKPSIYLDDGQIPKELKGAKVGDTVTLQVTGKVIRKSETADTSGISNSLGIEMGSIKTPGKKGKA